MKNNLVLVRHLTTSWNKAGKIQGHTNIPLDEDGRADARILAEQLKSLNIGHIIYSDLRRAEETAHIISSVLNVPATSDERLRECSFGTIEGLTRAEAIAKYGEPIASNWDDQYRSYDFCAYGGENKTQVLLRHLSLVNDLPKIYKAKTILLVGHGRGLNTLLASLGYPPNIKQREYTLIKRNFSTS